MAIVDVWTCGCGCVSFFVRVLDNYSRNRLRCSLAVIMHSIYLLTSFILGRWVPSFFVRKILNQVDQELINARYFGIWPGIFGLIQGGLTRRWRRSPPQQDPHVIAIWSSTGFFALHPDRRLDHGLFSRMVRSSGQPESIY